MTPTPRKDVKTPDPAGVMMLGGPLAFCEDGRCVLPPPSVVLRGPPDVLTLARPIDGADHVEWVVGTYVIAATPVGWVGRWIGLQHVDGTPDGFPFQRPC
jgi:hypothetical protein